MTPLTIIGEHITVLVGHRPNTDIDLLRFIPSSLAYQRYLVSTGQVSDVIGKRVSDVIEEGLVTS